MKKKTFLLCFAVLIIITTAKNNLFAAQPMPVPQDLTSKDSSQKLNMIISDIYRKLNRLETGVDNVSRETKEKKTYEAFEIITMPTGNQPSSNLESAINAQAVTIYNLTVSTIPGAVDWTAATTTFYNISGDTLWGVLKSTYVLEVSTTIAGLKRIEWADGSVTTFAVTGGATNAELQAFKVLMGDTTYFIAVSTGFERSERIAADNLLLPLDGTRTMTGNLNMGTKNILNTSTHTVNTLNVTQINWADGQVSTTSHLGDMTEAQSDARYIKKVGGDNVFGSLKTTYYMQISTTIAGVQRIEWGDGSVSTTDAKPSANSVYYEVNAGHYYQYPLTHPQVEGGWGFAQGNNTPESSISVHMSTGSLTIPIICATFVGFSTFSPVAITDGKNRADVTCYISSVTNTNNGFNLTMKEVDNDILANTNYFIFNWIALLSR